MLISHIFDKYGIWDDLLETWRPTTIVFYSGNGMFWFDVDFSHFNEDLHILIRIYHILNTILPFSHWYWAIPLWYSVCIQNNSYQRRSVPLTPHFTVWSKTGEGRHNPWANTKKSPAAPISDRSKSEGKARISADVEFNGEITKHLLFCLFVFEYKLRLQGFDNWFI